MPGSMPPDPITWITGLRCAITRVGPEGDAQHYAWTSRTPTDGEAMFHKAADVRPGDLVTFKLPSSSATVQRTVDTAAPSLDGRRKRVTWRVPEGIPFALSLSDLHPAIQKSALGLYRDGHFAEAIGAAAKALEVAVRDRAALPPSGNLMGDGFGDDGPLSVRQHHGTTGEDEQTGFRFLFMGAARALRNPRAHEFIEDDSVSAMEHLALVRQPPFAS